MKKIICITLALVMLFTVSSLALTPDEAAADLGKYGIMGGFPDGSLRLEENVTRAQMTKMIVTAMGEDDISGFPLNFSDVPGNDWAAPYIAYAQHFEIVGGFPDRTFRPKDNVTCAQVIKMVACMLKYDKYMISRRGGGELYYPQDYIKALWDEGMLEGLDIGDGSKPATRGFVAVLMARALDAPMAYDPAEREYIPVNQDRFWKIADGKDGRPNETLRIILEK